MTDPNFVDNEEFYRGYEEWLDDETVEYYEYLDVESNILDRIKIFDM